MADSVGQPLDFNGIWLETTKLSKVDDMVSILRSKDFKVKLGSYDPGAPAGMRGVADTTADLVVKVLHVLARFPKCHIHLAVRCRALRPLVKLCEMRGYKVTVWTTPTGRDYEGYDVRPVIDEDLLLSETLTAGTRPATTPWREY